MTYADWRVMTRWQRRDILLRHRMELMSRARSVRGKGWREIASALLHRALGF